MEKEEIKFTSYPEGYKKAADSLKFIPEDQREAILDAVVNTIIKQ